MRKRKFSFYKRIVNFLSSKRYPKLSATVDLEQIYDEFVETTLDELDYIKEGQHADTLISAYVQQLLSDAFFHADPGETSVHCSAKVPRIYEE